MRCASPCWMVCLIPLSAPERSSIPMCVCVCARNPIRAKGGASRTKCLSRCDCTSTYNIPEPFNLFIKVLYSLLSGMFVCQTPLTHQGSPATSKKMPPFACRYKTCPPKSFEGFTRESLKKMSFTNLVDLEGGRGPLLIRGVHYLFAGLLECTTIHLHIHIYKYFAWAALPCTSAFPASR